jgi:hypothetical protein
MANDRWYNVYAKVAQLLYTDTTAKKLFTLPSGATPVHILCHSDEASVGAELDVGVADNTDSLIDGLDVSGAGTSVGTLLSNTKLTVPTDVWGVINGTPASGGPFDVTVIYIMSRSRKVV